MFSKLLPNDVSFYSPLVLLREPASSEKAIYTFIYKYHLAIYDWCNYLTFPGESGTRLSAVGVTVAQTIKISY